MSASHRPTLPVGPVGQCNTSAERRLPLLLPARRPARHRPHPDQRGRPHVRLRLL